MAFEFKLPDLGEGLTEGEIVKWLVKVGDTVSKDQIFVQVETDKAVIEIPSPEEGIVLDIRAEEGRTVEVGQVILVIGAEGETPAAPPKTEAPKDKKEEKPVRPASVGVVGTLEEAPDEEEAAVEIQAAPAVRKLAKDKNVDLGKIKGTGPEGRITKEDVLQAAEKVEEKPKKHFVRKYDMYGYVEHVTLKGMRKTIARAMAKSRDTAAHVTSTDEADITRLAALRDKAKAHAAKKGVKLTYLPFFIKAVVPALEQHPYLNATLDDENEDIILKKYFNIGIAVDTPDGLMVPVVKNAKDKSIYVIAEELTDHVRTGP